MRIILGSASSGRRKVLTEAGFQFETITADIDEKSIRSDDFYELPLILARAKSDKLQTLVPPGSILITCDLVVICNGQLREKPSSVEEARYFMESYSQYPAETVSAVVVCNTATGKIAEGKELAKIYFRPIPMKVMEDLLIEGLVLKAAGSFMVEHPVMKNYVEKIEGEREGIIGLPLKLTKKLMSEVGWDGKTSQ